MAIESSGTEDDTQVMADVHLANAAETLPQADLFHACAVAGVLAAILTTSSFREVCMAHTTMVGFPYP